MSISRKIATRVLGGLSNSEVFRHADINCNSSFKSNCAIIIRASSNNFDDFVDEEWEARKSVEDWQTRQPPMKRPQPPVPGRSTPPSDKVLDLADRILALNYMDLHLYIKCFSARTEIRGNIAFDLVPRNSAATPQPATEPEKEVVQEKNSFIVKLVGFDPSSKIKVIKEVRSLLGLGLKEAKDLVEGVPKPLKKDLTKEEAEALVKKLTENGAVCSMD